MEKFSKFVIRFRWPVIAVFLIFTVIMGMQIKKVKYNADMLTYLPEDMPSRVHKKQIENIFGGTEMVMVVFKTGDVINESTLNRIKTFSLEMKKIKEIDKVMSLFETKQVRSEDDAMLVDPAVRMVPHNAAEVEEIKKELKENDMVYGSVVSKDFTTTAVIGTVVPGSSDEKLVKQLNEIIKAHPGKEKVMLGGSPYTRYLKGVSMKSDMGKLMPIGLIFMLIFLFISFRQFRGVWMPTLVVIISIFVSLGFVPLFGWDFTVVTAILPVLLIAVANDYGIHMLSHYQDDNYPGNTFTKKEISLRMATSLGKPILLAGFTTMVGLLCMWGHILIPAWQMGIQGAIGIAVALLASLLLIPAISSLLPKPGPIATPANTEGNKGIMNKLLPGISNLVIRKPKAVIITLSAVTILISTGIFNVSVNNNPNKTYPEGHIVRTSSNLINAELGGFMPLAIVFEGDIKEPALLKKIDELEKKIKAMPEVGITQSIAKVTRQIGRALYNEGEPLYDSIPGSYNAVSQYFELYMMNGEADDLEKMVDFNFEKAMILVRLKEMETPVLRKCVKEIKEMTKNDPDIKYIGGAAEVYSEMDYRVVDGQFKSLGISLFAILLILGITFRFRSVRGAVLQIIPLVMAILVLFGIMGLFRIDLNSTTALLSSIMIGVGIDYTVHLVWRYREERRNGKDAAEAMQYTIHTTGRGIILNAASVIIGFTALIFSEFLSVRFFGILMVVMIFTCLVGGLLLVPALCMFFKPEFLEPEGKKR